MITIPNSDTKKFLQPNYGDTQGNLWATFNVNLTKNTGRVRLNRAETVFDSSDDSDLRTPMAFAYYDPSTADDPIFIAYGNKVFFGTDDPISTFTQDTLTNSPSYNSMNGDLKVFNDKLYATEATKLKRLDHGDAAWTDIATISSGGIHQLCNYGKRLYWVDEKAKIHSMDDAETVVTTGSYTIDLSYFNGHISWIKEGSNRIWIGFTSNNGGRGMIFEWDGVTENVASKSYTLEAQGSAGCAIWDDVPYVLDIEGRLMAFNGGGFQEVARLPIMQYDVLDAGYATINGEKICHFNGIQYINDAIVIMVAGDTTGDTGSLETYPGGIYEYTKENGIVHKLSPSITKFGNVTLDYGQQIIDRAGAIFDASIQRTNTSNYYASVMFGANVNDVNGNNLYCVCIDIMDDRINDEDHVRSGYIVTPFIESSQITDVWQKIVIKYRKFLDNSAKIMVKYRLEKDLPLVFQGVSWTSDTVFTDTGSTYANVSIGDEAEILSGSGAGATAHVTNIVNSSGTYTVTLDTQIVGVSSGDESWVRIQKWKLLPLIENNDKQFKELVLPNENKSTEIQVKVVMEWLIKENELREVNIINKADQYKK